MSPDYAAALAFLEQWKPGGPWVLTAISLDKKSIETATFRDPANAQAWLERVGQASNLYFSVNPVLGDCDRKPAREDVASMDWLHVDIDPRAGEAITEEQARALQLLRQPPDGIPPPTVIVFSGGGYQGFWKLTQPVDIQGREPAYLEAARYNQALELAFGADNCHNVDRIMRLPGTINRPDERKRKKGRSEALATLVEWHHDRTYSISQFRQANAMQTGDTATSAGRVQVSGNVARVADVNDLPVNDLCKVVIVQGHDPDNLTRFPSRSEALFFVCCEMVRGGCTNDTIFAVITDPEFRISDSVREKRGSAERYALRQIERAREHAINPDLPRMNDRYAVVGIGGRMRVVTEQWDPAMRRPQLQFLTFEDFRNKHLHERIVVGQDAQGNPKTVRLGHWWLEHVDRRQYESVVFCPGQDTPGHYNLWQGFTTTPVPGELHRSFLAHVRDNVCSGDKAIFDYVESWMARAVQAPGEPGQTAIVLRGNQGTGKGFFATHFGRLFGRHYVAVSSSNRLTGNFNSHLRDCVVLFCDEAFWGGDKRQVGPLKALITEDTIVVEPKGVDSQVVPNCLHIIMASNEAWVVPAGMRERRFCVLDIATHRIQDHRYFGAIAADLRDGGYAHLLHHLLHRDISNFRPGNLPQTEALLDQKRESLDPYQDWWLAKLTDGLVLPEHTRWETEVSADLLIADFQEHMSWNRSTRAARSKLGNFLRDVVPNLSRHQRREPLVVGAKTVARPYFLQLAPLEACRLRWTELHGEGWRFAPIPADDGGGEPF